MEGTPWGCAVVKLFESFEKDKVPWALYVARNDSERSGEGEMLFFQKSH